MLKAVKATLRVALIGLLWLSGLSGLSALWGWGAVARAGELPPDCRNGDRAIYDEAADLWVCNGQPNAISNVCSVDGMRDFSCPGSENLLDWVTIVRDATPGDPCGSGGGSAFALCIRTSSGWAHIGSDMTSLAVFGNGSALDCGGNDSYSSASGEFDFDVDTQPFSISLWARSSAFGVVVGRGRTTLDRQYQIISGSYGRLAARVGGTARWTGSLLSNDWHHVALVSEPGGFRIYHDGVDASGLVAHGSEGGGSDLRVCSRQSDNSDGHSGFMTGQVDELSVWSTALSAAQVSEIYNSGAAADLKDHSGVDGLISWYRFGDDPGGALRDSHGANALSQASGELRTSTDAP